MKIEGLNCKVCNCEFHLHSEEQLRKCDKIWSIFRNQHKPNMVIE